MGMSISKLFGSRKQECNFIGTKWDFWRRKGVKRMNVIYYFIKDTIEKGEFKIKKILTE